MKSSRILTILACGVTIAALAACPCPAQESAPEGTAQEQVIPKKVEIDSDFDGTVDRTEVYDADGQISRIEVDTNKDGKVNEWITYKSGKPVQTQRDSNGDGKVDVWIEY